MQRALGMDMTTPRSKSQQQIHSPSHHPKPDPTPPHSAQPKTQPPQFQQSAQTKTQPPHSQPSVHPKTHPPHSQPSVQSRTDQSRSAGSSPARRPVSAPEPIAQDGLTKLFGFGASLLNQASTLISVDPLPGGGASPQPSPSHQPGGQGARVVFSDANAKATSGPPAAGKPVAASVMPPQGPHAPPQKQPQQQSPAHHQKGPLQQQSPVHHQKVPQQVQHQSPLKQAPPASQAPKVNCPLCKTELNIGSSEPANFNSCTQCHTQVCNLCGFNPAPDLLEKKEWLCLNCQTQRLRSGGLDDLPLPVPHPSPKHQAMGSPRHQVLASQQPDQQSPFQKVSGNQQQGPKAVPPQQKASAAQGSGPFVPTGSKQAGDMKPFSQSTSAPTSTTVSVSEAQRKDNITPKLDKELKHVSAVTEETKPTNKKGTTEIITTTTPTKDEKKESLRSRCYEVILFLELSVKRQMYTCKI
uniref:Zinc finger piccolo-type domain-containing protein n=1 Tax=Electrophorus electricus TaxID=8005 RepID=A0A4W4ETF3_ELEEL